MPRPLRLLVAAGVVSAGLLPVTRLAAAEPVMRGLRTAAWVSEAVAAARTGAGKILVHRIDGQPIPLASGAARSARLAEIGVDVLAVPDVARALTEYKAMPGVAWAEPDRTVVAASAPNDQLYPLQWTLHSAAASPWSTNWEGTYPFVQGAGALVAVVDTGFKAGGDDQPANVRTDLARNFVANTADASDDNGHGTFVTNEIAEATGNALGAAGVAPQASILPVKVLGADGSGDLAVVAAGIDYAASAGAKVINLSLAGDQSPTLCAAVAQASKTAVVLAASGNDASAGATKSVDDPAGCPGALAIGSIAYDGTRPPYANTGCALAAVAPGGDDLARANPMVSHSDWVLQQSYDANPADGVFYGTFQYFQEEGTSMSAALVSGEAALLIGMGATVEQTEQLIVGTARDAGDPGVDATFGAGAVDITTAVSDFHAGFVPPPPIRGYRIVSAAGGVETFSDPCENGDFGHLTTTLAQPVVGTASTPSGMGYWLVASDGGIFDFGDAGFYGSTGALHLARPVVGMAPTPSGHGYWLVASDGGIFAFGDAAFYGSTGAIKLNKPIVGMAPTRTGHGYWLVASDGGMFAFGDAAFHGSTGALPLVSPMVGMAPTPTGHGYWLVAADGGVFTFGDAPYEGSAGAQKLVSPVVGITPTSDGRGYLLAAGDGGVFQFGDGVFYGAAGGSLGRVVGIAGEPWPGL